MPREYRHISQYEKEIVELRNEGFTFKEIGEKYGFTFRQLHNFFTRYNKKQEKLKAVHEQSVGIFIFKKSF